MADAGLLAVIDVELQRLLIVWTEREWLTNNGFRLVQAKITALRRLRQVVERDDEFPDEGNVG